MRLHVGKMKQWKLQHDGRSTVRDLVVQLEHNIRVRRGTERSWAAGFAIAFTWPLMTLASYAVCVQRSPATAVEVWFFFFDMMHFLIQAVWVFNAAGIVSSAS